jgi:hypothetical protein
LELVHVLVPIDELRAASEPRFEAIALPFQFIADPLFLELSREIGAYQMGPEGSNLSAVQGLRQVEVQPD